MIQLQDELRVERTGNQNKAAAPASDVGGAARQTVPRKAPWTTSPRSDRGKTVSSDRRRRWAGLILLGAAELSLAAAPPEPDRAELLYENHCMGCHTSVVHVREDRRARSSAEVRMYVRRWSDNQHLGWSENDVVDVGDFLLRRYYQFVPMTPTPGTRSVPADRVTPAPVK